MVQWDWPQRKYIPFIRSWIIPRMSVYRLSVPLSIIPPFRYHVRTCFRIMLIYSPQGIFCPSWRIVFKPQQIIIHHYHLTMDKPKDILAVVLTAVTLIRRLSTCSAKATGNFDQLRTTRPCTRPQSFWWDCSTRTSIPEIFRPKLY